MMQKASEMTAARGVCENYLWLLCLHLALPYLQFCGCPHQRTTGTYRLSDYMQQLMKWFLSSAVEHLLRKRYSLWVWIMSDDNKHPIRESELICRPMGWTRWDNDTEDSNRSELGRGGNLEGTGGPSPQVWGGGTAHAFVPPIFWVVLLDVRESMKRVKKVFFLWGKGHVRHLTK